MKLNIFIVIIALTIIGVDCASVKSDRVEKSDRLNQDKEYVIENPIALSDFLRNVPGVTFDWTTGVPMIRGGAPLYVIDGVRMGHNYYEVAGLVNIQNIASVEVIKSATEGLIYGRDVANGVIIIQTKSGQPQTE